MARCFTDYYLKLATKYSIPAEKQLEFCFEQYKKDMELLKKDMEKELLKKDMERELLKKDMEKELLKKDMEKELLKKDIQKKDILIVNIKKDFESAERENFLLKLKSK